MRTLFILILTTTLFAQNMKNKSYPGHEYADKDTYLIPQTADLKISPYMALMSCKLLILYGTKETKGSTVKYVIFEENGKRLIRLAGKSMILPAHKELYVYTFSEEDLLQLVALHRIKLNYFLNVNPPTASSKVISSYNMIAIESAMMLLFRFKYGPQEGEREF